MELQKIVAILFIVAGVLGLAYGGFSYTKATHETQIGPLHMAVNEKEYVSVPLWAGIGGIVIGGLLLFSSKNGRN